MLVSTLEDKAVNLLLMLEEADTGLDERQKEAGREKLRNMLRMMREPMHGDPWLCRDGREMKLEEMTTDHINFAIAKIMRSEQTPKWRHKWLPFLVKELERRMKENGEERF